MARSALERPCSEPDTPGSVRADMSDRRILYAAAFLRALATGMVGVLIGVYVAKLGLDAFAMGRVVAAGLAGAALSALVVTLTGDRLGRRRSLVALSLLAAAGGMTMSSAPVTQLEFFSVFFNLAFQGAYSFKSYHKTREKSTPLEAARARSDPLPLTGP